ncbi:MAG TPA: hypothetical protein ENI07_24485 [Desulfobacterales bacterium]|nr:hypothetical protein [Desulfobacterales bacterium]
MLDPFIHIFLHFAIPVLFVYFFLPKAKFRSIAILWATMVVDFDHLWATPVYDPSRCGIGFHPLHSYPAIILYALGIFIPKIRLVAIGLIIHMGLDYTDCLWMKFG